MGRPNLTGHPKFRRFCRILRGETELEGGLVQPLARGMLELLWEQAYMDGCPVLGDQIDVAEFAQWPGPPETLIAALSGAGGRHHIGFIEAGPLDGSWRVHDLFRNAPRYVRQRRLRSIERETGIPYKELTECVRRRELDLDHPQIEHRWVFPSEEESQSDQMSQSDPNGAQLGLALEAKVTKPAKSALNQAKRRRLAPNGAYPFPSLPVPSRPDPALLPKAVRAQARDAAAGSPRRGDFRSAVRSVLSDVCGRTLGGGDYKVVAHWFDRGVEIQRVIFVIEWLGARMVVSGENISSLRYFIPALPADSYPQPVDGDEAPPDTGWTASVLHQLEQFTAPGYFAAEFRDPLVLRRPLIEAVLAKRPTDAVAWGVREGLGAMFRRIEEGGQS